MTRTPFDTFSKQLLEELLLPFVTRTRIEALTGPQVEALADALLDLNVMADLDSWLEQSLSDNR
jgi:hypothetical protein